MFLRKNNTLFNLDNYSKIETRTVKAGYGDEIEMEYYVLLWYAHQNSYSSIRCESEEDMNNVINVITQAMTPRFGGPLPYMINLDPMPEAEVNTNVEK